MTKSEEKRGLVQIYTGNGKGKTTAALGLAMRAAGQGLKVLFVQFVKGDSLCGEHFFVKKYGPFQIVQPSNKSSFMQTPEELCLEADKAMLYTEEVVFNGGYDMIILDELCYALDQGYLPLHRVLDLLHKKPASLEMVLTGRGAPKELIDEADLVTEMVQVKHPFERGTKARKGIEY